MLEESLWENGNPRTKLFAVRSGNRATVDDAGAVRDGRGHGLGEERTDVRVGLLRLGGRRDLAGTYGPDGLVRNHDLAAHTAVSVTSRQPRGEARHARPVCLFEELRDRRELGLHDLGSLARLALCERLADAENHREAVVERDTRLLGDELGSLVEKRAPLRVAWNTPAQFVRGCVSDVCGEVDIPRIT